ncbi:MAG: hypothetical protein GY696_16535 [Gammaproteobacteria bacterium]|nr:hypothetical protein [Gammaproteobacteria bacterium]
MAPHDYQGGGTIGPGGAHGIPMGEFGSPLGSSFNQPPQHNQIYHASIRRPGINTSGLGDPVREGQGSDLPPSPLTPRGVGQIQSPGPGLTSPMNPEDIKPRSLRFTWSMKTTSSMAPEEMMREIR